EKGQKALERLFSPEFRNRLDAVVHFSPLEADAVERVVDKFMTQLDAQLAAKRVTVELTPAARRWLAQRGYDRTFGARPLAPVIQEPLTRARGARRAARAGIRSPLRRGSHAPPHPGAREAPAGRRDALRPPHRGRTRRDRRRRRRAPLHLPPARHAARAGTRRSRVSAA